MIEVTVAVIAAALRSVSPLAPAPWIDGGTALTFFGALVGIITLVSIFRTGANNRIDAKRESELTRVYARLDVVEETQGVVVRIAVRAIRQIETAGETFKMSDEEYEALERTRPLGEKFTPQQKEGSHE